MLIPLFETFLTLTSRVLSYFKPSSCIPPPNSYVPWAGPVSQTFWSFRLPVPDSHRLLPSTSTLLIFFLVTLYPSLLPAYPFWRYFLGICILHPPTWASPSPTSSYPLPLQVSLFSSPHLLNHHPQLFPAPSTLPLSNILLFLTDFSSHANPDQCLISSSPSFPRIRLFLCYHLFFSLAFTNIPAVFFFICSLFPPPFFLPHTIVLLVLNPRSLSICLSLFFVNGPVPQPLPRCHSSCPHFLVAFHLP